MTRFALTSAAIGLGIGLIMAWFVWPVEYTDADPSALGPSYKDDLVQMISASFVVDRDLTAARQWLNQLGRNYSSKTFSDLIARDQASANDSKNQEALAILAQALGFDTAEISQLLSGGTDAGSATPPAAPTHTQVVPAFRLAERTQLTCAEEPNEAHLRVFVRDAKDRELPNVEIEIRWADGAETVFTGLKPERGLGYADYEAAPGTFSLDIANAQSDVASNLVIGDAPANCKADRGATPRGWKIVFQQK